MYVYQPYHWSKDPICTSKICKNLVYDSSISLSDQTEFGQQNLQRNYKKQRADNLTNLTALQNQAEKGIKCIFYC